MLWEVSLDIHTLCVEKKLLLFCLSIERSLGSEEGTCDQQMMPELLNERLQRKVHDLNLENAMKNPMIPCFRHSNEVCTCSRFCSNRQTDRQTDRLNDYHNSATHAPRVNYGACTIFIHHNLNSSHMYMYVQTQLSGCGHDRK